MRTRIFFVALVTTAAAATCAFLADAADAQSTETLSEGPVKALPPDGSFLSVVDFRQSAGANFGPHGHIPGFVYVVDGTATIDENGSEKKLSEGEAQFIAALAPHTHGHSDDRLPAGLLAVCLLVVAIAAVLVVELPGARAVLLPVLLAALVAGSAVALWNPWQNEWFFIGVRPESARGGPMPTPGATRTYESPTFAQSSPGPYVESLARTTVDPQGEMAVPTATGPVVLLVLDGRADVTVGDRALTSLGRHEAALVQPGESARVVNPGGTELRLLRFALTPTKG